MTITFGPYETRSYRTNDLAAIVRAIYGSGVTIRRVRGSRYHVSRKFGEHGVGVVARLRVTY